MEKRAIIAIVVSMLILIVYQFLFAPPQQVGMKKDKKPAVIKEEFREKEQEEVAKTIEKTPAVQKTKPFDLKPLSREEKQGKEITVETDLLKIVLTNKGGRIKGIYMKKYRDRRGKTFNLVNRGLHGELPLFLKLQEPSLTKIANEAVYNAFSDTLVLDSSRPTGRISMTYDSPNGISISKNLTFYNDYYHIDVEIDIKGVNEYTVFWGPGLNTSKEKEDSYSYDGAAALINDKKKDYAPKKINSTVMETGDIKWVALQNKYFLSALIPKAPPSFALLEKDQASNISVGINLNNLKGGEEDRFKLYVGPKEDHRLKAYGIGLEKIIDYGWFSFLSLPLLVALRFLNGLIGNYGFAIIILTILIKIVFYPLTEKSFKSMQAMQKIQPKMKALQEIYKNDKQRLNQEIMSLYKQNKVNPAGGCLPMLIQVPIFIALYEVLLYSIDVRQTPFILWINDLSAKDPYYVFPILMGISMYVQQKMTPTAGDPRYAQIMNFMPIVFTFMFLNFPVGLVIYWLVNNLLTIFQQYIIKTRASSQKEKA
ncbi:MAG TPA: membrane protein insertase YidC [Nitrospinota bacterium]|nr:membrane protein insertase YidC [Nitrospinota bacterium]